MAESQDKQGNLPFTKALCSFTEALYQHLYNRCHEHLKGESKKVWGFLTFPHCFSRGRVDTMRTSKLTFSNSFGMRISFAGRSISEFQGKKQDNETSRSHLCRLSRLLLPWKEGNIHQVNYSWKCSLLCSKQNEALCSPLSVLGALLYRHFEERGKVSPWVDASDWCTSLMWSLVLGRARHASADLFRRIV